MNLLEAIRNSADGRVRRSSWLDRNRYFELRTDGNFYRQDGDMREDNFNTQSDNWEPVTPRTGTATQATQSVATPQQGPANLPAAVRDYIFSRNRPFGCNTDYVAQLVSLLVTEASRR